MILKIKIDEQWNRIEKLEEDPSPPQIWLVDFQNKREKLFGGE